MNGISPNLAGRAPGTLSRAIETPWRRPERRTLARQALLGACRRERQSSHPAPQDGGTVCPGTLTAAQAWLNQPYLPRPVVRHATAMCRMRATMWQGGVWAPPPLLRTAVPLCARLALPCAANVTAGLMARFGLPGYRGRCFTSAADTQC